MMAEPRVPPPRPQPAQIRRTRGRESSVVGAVGLRRSDSMGEASSYGGTSPGGSKAMPVFADSIAWSEPMTIA